MSSDRADYRADLDGLRGIAILLVVLFHAGVRGIGGAFVAVDVFFVLSGYFITRLLLREAEATGRLDVGAFYRRRALRLLPALLIVLLATLALVMWLYAPIDRPAIASHARAVALYASNVELARTSVDYFHAQDNPLLHTWSLAVEEQFYLLWPLLFVLVGAAALSTDDVADGRRARRRLLIAMVGVTLLSFVMALLTLPASQPWAYFGTPSRMWEFAFGGVLALVLPDARDDGHGGARAAALSALGLAAILVPVFLYDRFTPHPGWPTVAPVLGTGALIAARRSAGPGRALEWPPLRWLGRHSYAWYLWHLPLVGAAIAVDHRIGVAGKLAWSLAALGLAWLTQRYIEEPARRGESAWLRSGWIMPAAIAVSVLVAVVAHVTFMVAESEVSSTPQKTFARARVDRMPHECWAATADAPPSESECSFGDRTSSRVIALLGDSHAEHWLGALDRAGRAHGWKILAMVKGGCPVADIPELKNRRLRTYYHECTRYREAMVQRIIAMRPTAVLLSSWDHYAPARGEPEVWHVTLEQWREGLRRTYSRLTQAGIRTIVIRGTPRTYFDVPACLSRKAAALPGATSCTYDRGAAMSPRARAAQTEAARGLPVRFVDMNDVICSSSPCATMRNGVVIFTDDNHLTATFSTSVAPILGRRLDALLGN